MALIRHAEIDVAGERILLRNGKFTLLFAQSVPVKNQIYGCLRIRTQSCITGFTPQA